MKKEEAELIMSSLYEQSGGDTSVCEFCEKPLDVKKPWKRGLDGAGAHIACIPNVYPHD